MSETIMPAKRLAENTIKGNIFRLELSISEYCVKQKEIWQLIPNLALEAEGIAGFSDQRRTAYMHGLWKLGARGYKYEPCVDLETGKLVIFDHQENTFISLSNSSRKNYYFLDIAKNLEQLDADYVVEGLREKISIAEKVKRRNRGHTNPLSCTIESLEAWKSEMRRVLNLGERYKRPDFIDPVDLIRAQELYRSMPIHLSSL